MLVLTSWTVLGTCQRPEGCLPAVAADLPPPPRVPLTPNNYLAAGGAAVYVQHLRCVLLLCLTDWVRV
jgi:hypothetical protein